MLAEREADSRASISSLDFVFPAAGLFVPVFAPTRFSIGSFVVWETRGPESVSRCGNEAETRGSFFSKTGSASTATALGAGLRSLYCWRNKASTEADGRLTISWFAVSGRGAVPVLNAACSLDLREAAFPVDSCAQTRFDQIPVVIFRSSPERFDIFAERPLADHLWLWMCRAVNDMRE